ncbi:MAG: alpha/beta hydrolase [Myxococcota bacterium]
MMIVLATLGVGYLAICGLLFTQQRAIVFPAPKDQVPLGPGARRIDVPGATHVLFREAPGGGPVVVHFHGNAEQVGHLQWLAAAYAERGISFAAVEYPGYPGAAGSPSEESLLAAAVAALEHLTKVEHLAPERLVLVGQSIGSGVAVQLAVRGWGRRLILLTPYTSLPDVGARAFSWLPIRLLMRDRFDSLAAAPQIKVPTLIVHGTRDRVIPFELGVQLSTAIAGSRLLRVDGADHNELWDSPAVYEQVVAFITGAR